MGRPRKEPPMIIEHLSLPNDMMRRLNEMSERRAMPLMQEAIYMNRSIRQAVRDIYLQGLSDGYGCTSRAEVVVDNSGEAR